MTHNYLQVKLSGKPLAQGSPMWDWVFLIAQTPKYNLRELDGSKLPALPMRYQVELMDFQNRRSVELMNPMECYMFCKHVEWFVRVELMHLLDESENYNDTFFDFQEKYGLSDLDFSRDNMYQWYERYHKGMIPQRYRAPVDGWLYDHLG